jgi:hypothetical protein
VTIFQSPFLNNNILAIEGHEWIVPCQRVYGSAYSCLQDVSKKYDNGILLGVVVGAGILF